MYIRIAVAVIIQYNYKVSSSIKIRQEQACLLRRQDLKEQHDSELKVTIVKDPVAQICSPLPDLKASGS